MKLSDKETIFTLKQRIDELKKWISLMPDSFLRQQRETELLAAKDQLSKFENK